LNSVCPFSLGAATAQLQRVPDDKAVLRIRCRRQLLPRRNRRERAARSTGPDADRQPARAAIENGSEVEHRREHAVGDAHAVLDRREADWIAVGGCVEETELEIVRSVRRCAVIGQTALVGERRPDRCLRRQR
jgi:hypothetical protein